MRCNLRKLGKYEILEELGRGAMGVVYKARNPALNQLVALKTITANVADNPDLLERFYREAKTAASLQHPNIVTVYDASEEGGEPFIVMQLVDGQNLANMIAQRASIPLSLKLVYAVEACRAFAYAHKQGIVHRDIKPGNIMISKEGMVKVVDFGIARVLENSKTQTGMLIGTFAYMAPELYYGERADALSDIFAFGVLLFELFSYTRPFPGEAPASLMQGICHKEPIPLRDVAPECPPELAAAIHRTLLKSPSERTPSMEDLLLELDPICKSLQAQTMADLVAQAKSLFQAREFGRARELLVQALQLDFANRQAKSLLDEVNVELKRIQIRPRVEKHVNAGRAFLHDGKIEEAQVEAETALRLDSTFEPAEELLRQVKQEQGRIKQISEWLEAAGERLAEGLPEEAEAFLSKIQELDPANRQAEILREQVQEETARRQRQIRLQETMQQARTLWMEQKYEDCINLLASLQNEFGDEEDFRKLYRTALEDRAEQQKHMSLERARTLLVAGAFADCQSLLTELSSQFPNDEEIPELLEKVRKDEAEHEKVEALKEARSKLAARHYEECLRLLDSLKSKFPDETEVNNLVASVQEEREAELREQGLKDAQSLLTSQRFEECQELLGGLLARFPGNPEFTKLLETAREEQAEQRRQDGLSEAMKLSISKQFAESLALLNKLQTQYPNDADILGLLDMVQKDQAEQRRQEGLSEAHKLLASKQFAECLTFLTRLQSQFPNDTDIPALLDTVQKEQAEQRRQEGLSEAQKLLASKQFAESLALLAKLQEQFPEDKEIPKLAETVQKEQAEEERLRGLAEARKLRASRQYSESLSLLSNLQARFPNDKEILRLADAAQKDKAEQHKSEALAEGRKFLASKQYSECLALLAKLQSQFPNDNEVLGLSQAVQREQAEQRKLHGLLEARRLFGSKQYSECLSLVSKLKTQFPDDKEILRLVETVQKEKAEQEKLHDLAEARKLRASRQYGESLALLSELQAKFPGDKEVLRLAEAVQKEEAEQHKFEVLAEARKLLASKQFTESLARLSKLQTQFANDKEIIRLAEAVQREQAEHQKQLDLAKGRKLRAERQYAECLALLADLQKRFPDDKEIPRLAEGVRRDQAEQQKQESLAEARSLLTSQRIDESFAVLTTLRKNFPDQEDITRLITTVEHEKAERQRQHQLAEARRLLGLQQFADALAVIEPLLKANPKDAAGSKLRALILDEQEKAARAARLAQELKALKKLVSDESYDTVIGRADGLLKDFPNDVDLLRLLEFARSRKEQVERERRLGQIVEEVQKLIASNQLAEAIASARAGLEAFEGNTELRRLLEQAESQRKKEFTRQQIQQRVREIKTKIHREEFSDAMRMAQDALTTLGPDTDLTQLLTSAQVEVQSREKKRAQSQKLENVRALLDIGDIEGATLLLDNTIKEEELDTADPRVARLARDIAVAAGEKERTQPTTVTESGAKEYALPYGPSPVSAPEQQGLSETVAEPVASAAAVPASVPKSEIAATPEVAPEVAAPEVKITPEVRPRPVPVPQEVKELAVPFWRRPAVLGIELLGLILSVSAGAYLVHRSNARVEIAQVSSQRPPATPAKNLPETQQRDLIATADKAIAQGDFKVAQNTLEQAKNINGPLSHAIDEKLAGVEQAMSSAATAAVLQQEEALWSQATTSTQNGQFAEAQKALGAILKLGPEGRRKADARQYLNEVIPRRQREEQLFAQGQQALKAKDARSLQQAADSFGEVAKLNGPRQQAALRLQQDALANLTGMNRLAGLAEETRQLSKSGDFRGARAKLSELQQAGGDTATLSQEINAGESARFSQLDASLNQLKQGADEKAVQSLKDLQPQLQALADGGGPTANDARRDANSIPDAIGAIQARIASAREDATFQQATQRYRAAPNEVSALEASRSELEPISRAGGRHAADAQKLVDEINSRVNALSAATAAAASSAAISEARNAVLAAVQRYVDAFDRRDADAVRQVWPTMSAQSYTNLKNSFNEASAIQLDVANQKVDLGFDGASAVVNADITRNFTPKGGKTLVRREHDIFHLVKSNGTWTIKDLQ